MRNKIGKFDKNLVIVGLMDLKWFSFSLFEEFNSFHFLVPSQTSIAYVFLLLF